MHRLLSCPYFFPKVVYLFLCIWGVLPAYDCALSAQCHGPQKICRYGVTEHCNCHVGAGTQIWFSVRATISPASLGDILDLNYTIDGVYIYCASSWYIISFRG